MAFTFEKPKAFHFKAGQHVRLTLIDPPETDNEGDSRFFSLASTPQDSELTIAMRMRDTAFKRILNDMPLGSKVRVQILLDSPHSAFALHEDVHCPAVFIAGGIGIVPAYSMIKDALQRKLQHQILLLYSNRRLEDSAFLAELVKLADKHPQFKLVSTMTNVSKSDQQWGGLTGRIDEAFIKKYVPDVTKPRYYVSGLPGMTSAMQGVLAACGVPETHIMAEEFSGFDLNSLPTSNSKVPKSNLFIMLLAIFIIGVIALHVGAAQGILHTGFQSVSFSNPISYLVIGLLVVVLAVKFKLIFMGVRQTQAKRRK